MATSLTNQLQQLRTAPARHLTVEKRHVSLLFDKKEAVRLTDETAFRIGVAGLEQMKRIDPVFDTEIPNELFTEERIKFVRSMLEKQENDNLNEKINKLLFELSPYLQHFACQQVLEFLIHTYQIYAFNAEMLILTFLPFHETKVYARILRILDFDWERSKEWQFMKFFFQKENPIPFSSIVKATMSSSHSIITCITDHIKKGISYVGSDYLEVKHPMLFNFHAKLLLELFNDPERVDEMMLSKMMPFIENGIKSDMISFNYSSLMLISQLVLTVKLKDEILNSLCKLLITKIRSETVSSSLATLIAVFQQQNVSSFSKKTLTKLLKIGEEMSIWKHMKALAFKTDTSKFYLLLWKELFALLRDGSDENTELVENVLIETTEDLAIFHSSLASGFLNLVLREAINGNVITKKKLKANIVSIGTKYAKQFDVIYDELKKSDAKALKRIVDSYDLRNVVQFSVHVDLEKDGARETNNKAAEVKKTNVEAKLSAAEKAKLLANSSEFAKRQSFSGDPINLSIKWLDEKKWDKIDWALNEMSNRGPKYFNKKIDEEIEHFVVKVIKTAIAENNGSFDIPAVKAVISSVKLNPAFIHNLLTKFDEFAASAPKKAKGPGKPNIVQKVFGTDETADEFAARVVFVLEFLNLSTSVPVSGPVWADLFNIIKQGNAKSDIESSTYQQSLAINVVRKVFDNTVAGKISPNDVDIDCVIETMRSTHNHHLLRDCLRLIVSAAKHAPKSVVKHVMSVFTFMGNGMLRKDNDLTLSIVENTVESLFSTILSHGSANTTGANSKIERLIELAKLFAASAVDIPAHRRARIAQAIARAVGPQNASTVVLVLVAGFCARWQRPNDTAAQEAAKRGSDQDAYDDLAIELLGALNPFEQLSSVLEMCEYVLRMGGDRQPTQTGAQNEKPLPKKKNNLDDIIFDRNVQTLPRTRHYRYVIVTLISRIFASRALIEKLAAYDDEELLKNALPLGKRLIECSVELDEFANKEANKQDTNDAQTQRYWVAFASRTEVVSEKLRHLLPGGVAARLIADVLQECAKDTSAGFKMCEKVLQLANIKLGHDGYLFSDSGINEKELITLAAALNKFIVAETKSEERIMLCQNAAFTLKLIAKHLPTQSESTVLSETMQKCVAIVTKYQKLDENLTGNALLLAGELIRSHNMGSTIQHAITLLKTCLATVQECIVKFSKSQQFDSVSTNSPASGATPGRGTRGQRIRQQSLGHRLGSDSLLICSLTCIQRIFDQFSSFVTEYSGDVIVGYCRLVSRFGDPSELLSLNQPSSSNAAQYSGGSQTSGFGGNKTGIIHRLSLIRRALLTIEMRVIAPHVCKAVVQLKTEKKPICALFNLLTGFVENQNTKQKADVLRKSVVLLRDTFVSEIITPALEFRSQKRDAEQFENVEKLEQNIFNFVISMASILSEIEFRPIVNHLVSWSEAGLDTKSDLQSRLRLVSVLHFANCLYNAFNSLALPYFGRILEIATMVLKRCNSTVSDGDELLLSGKRGSLEALETDLAITLAIDLIANAARHKDFFTSDRCQLVTDVIINELGNTKVEGHEKRCSEHVVTAIYRIGNADPDNFTELLNKMMLKTRDSRPKIRYRTLLVLELLIEKIGDGIQPHLSLLLPFLNELIEDENKQVEAQCQKVINALQHKFGETFWGGASSA